MILTEEEQNLLACYMDAVMELANWQDLEANLERAGFTDVEDALTAIEDKLKGNS